MRAKEPAAAPRDGRDRAGFFINDGRRTMDVGDVSAAALSRHAFERTPLARRRRMARLLESTRAASFGLLIPVSCLAGVGMGPALPKGFAVFFFSAP